jgi:formate dehydrogenase
MNIAGAPPDMAVNVTTPEALRGQLRRRKQLKGRQPDDASRAEVRALIGPGPHRRDLLIERLHDLNDACHGLLERHLVALAAEMRLSMAEVFEVASFYHHFEVVRDGDTPAALTVRVCDGLSCAMAGAQGLLERLPAILGQDVRVIPAPCVGRCEQAPVAVVGQAPVLRADAASVASACTANARHHPVARDDGQFDPAGTAPCAITASPTEVAPAVVGYAAYRARGGYALAAAVVNSEKDAESVLRTMEDSGLRGLGGAGFPAGRKWRIVREQPAPRWMAVNIDEGEPGTFKDRWCLERDPHRFLEGLLIAAWAVGI